VDANRFDALTRILTAALSRRSLLHDVAGMTVAGSLALLGGAETEAKRRRHKRKKKRRLSAPKCSPACGSGMICVAGQCITGRGDCEAGADSCAKFASCAGHRTEDDCQCQLSIEGEIRCADNIAPGNSGCGDCGSSAECASLFPDIPGVFCNKGACCAGGERGLCNQPCPPAASCDTSADCPDALNACQIRTCEDGRCSRTFVPTGTELPEEPSQDGNCHRLVCDGFGNIRSEVDDTDAPCCSRCFTGLCANGVPMSVPDPAGTPCTDDQGLDGLCDGAGQCETAP
jgi:hypothetical protein